MMFRVGQKVVCVFDDPTWASFKQYGWQYPVCDEVYSVRDVGPTYPGGVHYAGVVPCVRLCEISNGPAGCGNEPNFYAWRFRPIVERKTDISVFHEILRSVDRRVDA